MDLALATTTVLLALTGGQLAGAVEEPVPVARPATEALVPPPPPAPAAVVVTADGVEHRGQIVGPAENGIELKTEIGGSQPIPLTLISRIEREEGLAAEPRALRLEPSPERIRERLTLTFDLHALSQRREALSWTSPIALLAVGALTTAAGALAFEGGSRYAVGGAGLIEALGAGVWLVANAAEGRSIDRAIEERRARLADLDRRP